MTQGGNVDQAATFFQNRIIMAGLFSWAAAQLIKVLITWWVDKKFDWRRCFGMGGMPSSHSAFVFSAALMCGLQEGFTSAAFAVSFILMTVVIYDALGVRAETGKQGAVLNHIIREILIEGKPITEDRLKELVGHTPLEVLGGILVGLIIVIIMA